MSGTNRKIQLLAGSLLATWLLTACLSAPRPPEVYSARTLSRTLLFPMVDTRNGEGMDLKRCNFPRAMQDSRVLKSSLSQLDFAANHGLTSTVSLADLEQRNAEKLRQIPTAGSHYAAFIYLERYSLAFASFKYRLTAYVVRADNGEVAWTRTLEDSIWQGVLDGPVNKLFGDVSFMGMRMNACAALEYLTRETFAGLQNLPAY